MRVDAHGNPVGFSPAFRVATAAENTSSSRARRRGVAGGTLWADDIRGRSLGHTMEWAPKLALFIDRSEAMNQVLLARGVHSVASRHMISPQQDGLLRAAFVDAGELPPL